MRLTEEEIRAQTRAPVVLTGHRRLAEAAYLRGGQDERKRILAFLDEATDTRDLDRRLQELKDE